MKASRKRARRSASDSPPGGRSAGSLSTRPSSGSSDAAGPPTRRGPAAQRRHDVDRPPGGHDGRRLDRPGAVAARNARRVERREELAGGLGLGAAGRRSLADCGSPRPTGRRRRRLPHHAGAVRRGACVVASAEFHRTVDRTVRSSPNGSSITPGHFDPYVTNCQTFGRKTAVAAGPIGPDGGRSSRETRPGGRRARRGRRRPGSMRIGYLIDLHKGGYDQPMPSPRTRTHDGGDDRGGRSSPSARASTRSRSPTATGAPSATSRGPSSSSRSWRARPRRSRSARTPGSPRSYHPMKAAEQFAVIDNLSRGGSTRRCRAASTRATGMQFGIPQEKLLGRFLEAIKIWQRGVQGRAVRLRGQVLAGGAGPPRAPALPARAAGRSGAAATRAPRRSGARRPTASAGPATPSRS